MSVVVEVRASRDAATAVVTRAIPAVGAFGGGDGCFKRGKERVADRDHVRRRVWVSAADAGQMGAATAGEQRRSCVGR
jgi:hypothetical protein